MTFKRIEVINTAEEGHSLFTVIVDGRFASELTIDEALATVVRQMVRDGRMPNWLGSYEDWHAREAHYGHLSPVAGLLSAPQPGVHP